MGGARPQSPPAGGARVGTSTAAPNRDATHSAVPGKAVQNRNPAAPRCGVTRLSAAQLPRLSHAYEPGVRLTARFLPAPVPPVHERRPWNKGLLLRLDQKEAQPWQTP